MINKKILKKTLKIGKKASLIELTKLIQWKTIKQIAINNIRSTIQKIFELPHCEVYFRQHRIDKTPQQFEGFVLRSIYSKTNIEKIFKNQAYDKML